MLMKALETLSCIWLLMAISSAAHPSYVSSSKPAVLDINGRPLQRGEAYMVKSVQNRYLTFHSENSERVCPLFVSLGDGNLANPGYAVIFEPFMTEETVVREDSDFKVHFDAYTICVQSTFWRLNVTEPLMKRRLIELWVEEVYKSPNGYFRINKNKGAYNFAWCPLDVCPTCKPKCSSVGLLNRYGPTLTALDGGDAFPVTFQRVQKQIMKT